MFQTQNQLALNPASGPNYVGAGVRTQCSWVLHHDPFHLGPRQNPSLVGPASGTNWLGSCVRTHFAWVRGWTQRYFGYIWGRTQLKIFSLCLVAQPNSISIYFKKIQKCEFKVKKKNLKKSIFFQSIFEPQKQTCFNKKIQPNLK